MMFQKRRPGGAVHAPVAFLLLLGLGAYPLVACGGGNGGGGGDETEAASQPEAPLTLGPADGHDLPPTDLERVAVGTVAPDFSLQGLSGDTLTLSAFRGNKDVILIFYRGHW
jgi:hypothetical protein